MRIDISKLEHVHRVVKDGRSCVIARCPACAEEGGDNKGDHLIVYSDGRFGCVVNPGRDEDAHQHRKDIFELVGTKEPFVEQAPPPAYKPTLKMVKIANKTRIIPINKKPS